MKKVFAFICFVVVAKLALAQKDSLAFDDHGKYIYYKVVNAAAGTNANVLYGRCLAWFNATADKKTLKLTKPDAGNTACAGGGVFTVSKKGSLGKHEDGGVTYKLFVEIKDGKYRYWFTDFVYTPYQRDRYNNYVPVAGLEIPIEKADTKEDKKDVEHYLDECAAFAIRTGKKLEQYMAQQPQAAKKDTVAKKVIRINQW